MKMIETVHHPSQSQVISNEHPAEKLIRVGESNSDGATRLSRHLGEEVTLAAIARELHDGVTQDLWYLHSELACLVERLDRGSEKALQSDIARLTQVAQQAYKEIRSTLDLLNSKSKRRINLVSEISEVTEKFTELVAMKVELHVAPQLQGMEFPEKVARQVKGLVQEALWNSWRHSMCDHVSIELLCSRSELVLTISDNGCGFIPDMSEDNHYGLQNMAQRAESIQGSLKIDTNIGKGTQITLCLPIQSV